MVATALPVVVIAIGIGAYAFTASNTVPNTNVGSGSATVSGYTVTNLHYVLNTTNPLNIDSLTFTRHGHGRLLTGTTTPAPRAFRTGRE